LKVLFFSHQASFIYGGEVVTLEMLRALRDSGVQVEFASPDGPYAERARAVVPWHEIPSVEFNRNILKLPKFTFAYLRARSALKDLAKKFDVIHAQSLKAAVYCRGLSVPVIWHHHDIMPVSFANEMWLRWLARGVNHIVTPSIAAKRALIDFGIEDNFITSITNGFPVEEWRQRPRRTQEEFTVLVVGEISARKGSDWIPEIAKLLRARGGKFKILVAGEGLSEVAFAEAVKATSQGIPEIEFLGRRSDIPELLQKADALLVPSRQDPLPTVVVEAMLSGVPVVARPVGGIPEMLKDRETGFFCDSPNEFAENLGKLQSDLGLWRKMSETERMFAVEKFSAKRVAQDLTRLYRKILHQDEQ
jgi:glycosyltransferase involved in cell wall biosynthesis